MAISRIVKEKTNEFISKYIGEDTILPINITSIIQSEEVLVEYRFLDNDLSGLLIIQGDSKLIGVEKSHGLERKRFTLAHELGHLVLHNEESSLFVDNMLFKRQSDGYTTREERMEREANYFAASILMPEFLVRKEVNLFQKDLYEDENIEELAKKFGVSKPAMTFRLTNLGLI